MIKVCICGSRTFHNAGYMRECLDTVLPQGEEIVILSGVALGADQAGERYAAGKGFKVERFPADWRKNGRSAGMIRNKEMLEAADLVFAFWDGNSPGTKHMIEAATEAGKLAEVFTFETDDDIPF